MNFKMEVNEGTVWTAEQLPRDLFSHLSRHFESGKTCVEFALHVNSVTYSPPQFYFRSKLFFAPINIQRLTPQTQTDAKTDLHVSGFIVQFQ
jgi:hypothetical protein